MALRARLRERLRRLGWPARKSSDSVASGDRTVNAPYAFQGGLVE